MGRTSQPLVVWVDLDWRERPEILLLKEQGHTIQEITRPDLILSRAAWAWDDDRWPHLDIALKAARKKKKQ